MESLFSGRGTWRRCLMRTALAWPCIIVAAPSLAFAQSAAKPAKLAETVEEVVVTARLRSEPLLAVPVAVTAVTRQELDRYASASLVSIANQTPTLQVTRSAIGSGGQLTLRGITTSGSQAGFEQSVSVNLDGVQLSRGRIATQGFFDLQQVEILKGPQALFFGKNSPAGVISLVSAGPGDHFEGYAKAGYEFTANQFVGEAAVGGPVTDNLGVRLALRTDTLKGWMHNNSVAQPLPLNTPGIVNRRPGYRELLGRLTVAFRPTDNYDATLKVMQSRYRDDGPAQLGLQVTSCGFAAQPDLALSATFILFDPTGDCRPDSQMSLGGVSPAAAANWPGARADGQPFGKYDATTASLTQNWRMNHLLLTSVSGYYRASSQYMDDYDGTTYAIASAMQREGYEVASQELRLQSDYKGPLNFMIGGFIQSLNLSFFNASRIAPLPADPATGRLHSADTLGTTDGQTTSFFGQVRYDVTPTLELAGGARWTHEQKNSRLQNTYVHSFLSTVLAHAPFIDHYDDQNVSPEATLTWRPRSDLTVYGAYKTGFKSGGLGLSSTLLASTTLNSIKYGAEKVSGFEVGAKGRFLDNRLRLGSSVYRYRFTDLQVSSFDAVAVAFVIGNAGRVVQQGVELDAKYLANENLELRADVVYNQNRYGDFFTNCYARQTAAQGCTAKGQNLGGRPPPLSPDWTAVVGATYRVAIGSGTLGFSGDAHYSDTYYASASQSPLARQEAFWRYDAAIQLAGPDGRWELSIIGRNLSNKRNLVFVGDKPFTANGEQFGTVARPREIMLQATVRY